MRGVHLGRAAVGSGTDGTGVVLTHTILPPGARAAEACAGCSEWIQSWQPSYASGMPSQQFARIRVNWCELERELTLPFRGGVDSLVYHRGSLRHPQEG